MTGGPDVRTQTLSGTSGLPQPRKIIRADIDVAQNASQRTNFESRVPVHRHGCSDLLSRHHVMTPANAHNGEALGF